ncbi:hypothetical protein P3B99_009395 [Opitutia bacterium KCR 482]|nr:hypothetical protein [Opitutae bacterium KCR 482]
MNATTQIKNTVKICADSKRFDSPTDSETGSAVKFRQFDAVQFCVVFRTNGALADLSNAAYAELEISDIGALNRPEPRTASVLVRKRVSALETSLDESAVASGSCHATFELDKSDTKIDAGEKWLRIYAVDSDGSRTSFANGWIFVEPTYGEDSNLATPDDLKYLVSARDYAEVSEGYANGGGAGLSETSPYYKNNSKYFSEQAKAHTESSSAYAAQAESSAQSAEASAGIAGGYASNAADSAAFASVQAESASASASSAQSAKAEAESAKTAAQLAAASASSSDAGRLALTKSDSGTLYFSGGSASATPNLAFDTISVLFKTDFDFSVPQLDPVFFPFYVGKTTLGKFINVQYGNNNSLRAMINGVNAGIFNRSDIAALVGDGLNAFAFVFKKLADGNIQVSLFVNGVAVQNRATATAEYPTLESFISINKWGSSLVYAGTVRYSDFCILNFDVSAADAPYSLAEYQKGKRLPPFLSGGVYIKSNPDVVAQATPSAGNLGQTTQGTLAKSDDGYTLTLTSASTRRFWFKFDKKYPAGTWFRVRRGALTWDDMETTGSRISQTSLNVGTSTTSPYTTPVNDLPTSEAVDVVFQTPVDADMVGFPTWNGADVPTATISIPYFEFEVLGSTTALENYTFDGKIRDASGNESHATISGSVAGDIDNSVNQIYSAFSAKYTQENA